MYEIHKIVISPSNGPLMTRSLWSPRTPEYSWVDNTAMLRGMVWALTPIHLKTSLISSRQNTNQSISGYWLMSQHPVAEELLPPNPPPHPHPPTKTPHACNPHCWGLPTPPPPPPSILSPLSEHPVWWHSSSWQWNTIMLYRHQKVCGQKQSVDSNWGCLEVCACPDCWQRLHLVHASGGADENNHKCLKYWLVYFSE